MVKHRYRATESEQKQLKSVINRAKKFSTGVHTQEVTDSSSVVSTRKRLISYEIRRFCYFFSTKPYGSKFGSAQDPDRDPYADRTQWSGQHGEAFHGHLLIITHEEDLEEYYAVLEAWDAWQGLVPLWEFLRRQTEKTWEKQTVCAEGRR